MNDKELMRKPLRFGIDKNKELEKYLEEMALEGWKLNAIDEYLNFEKAEPQNTRYWVLIVEEKFHSEEEPTTELKAQIEHYKAAGWRYVDCDEHRVVFVAEREDAETIETDDKLKHKIMKKQIFSNYFKILLFNLPISGLVCFHRFNYFSTIILTEYAGIVLCLYLIGVIFWTFSSMFRSIIWYIRSRIALKKGIILKYTSFKMSMTFKKIKIVLSVSGAILSFLGMFSVIINGFVVVDFLFLLSLLTLSVLVFFSNYSEIKQNFCKIHGVLLISTFFVFILALVLGIVSASRIESKTEESSVYPITLEGLGKNLQSIRERECEINATFLASRSEYKDSTFSKTAMIAQTFEINEDETNINYSVFLSEYDFAVDFYVYGLTHRLFFDYVPADASAWGAKEVYVEKNSSYYTIVVYENVVFTYSGKIELEEKDIAYIKKAIGVS